MTSIVVTELCKVNFLLEISKKEEEDKKNLFAQERAVAHSSEEM